MAINYRPMSPTAYVAFVKATEAMWAKMSAAQRLDNTLYFIVDGIDDTIGKLYLGNTLIADGNGITDIGLDKLTGVDIKAINGGDVLMYNMKTGKWENVSLADEIGDLIKVFAPASEEEDGSVGLVPAPVAGEQDKFLRGDGSWANPTEAVALDLSTLKSRVDTLIGQDAGVSARVIATDIANDVASRAISNLIANAPEEFNTLKEISDWILDHPETADFVALSNRVGTVEGVLNGREGVTGLIAQVNTLNTTVGTLSGDVATLKGSALQFTTQISDLNSALKALQNTVGDHTTEIADIYARLMWQELYEE